MKLVNHIYKLCGYYFQDFELTGGLDTKVPLIICCSPLSVVKIPIISGNSSKDVVLTSDAKDGTYRDRHIISVKTKLINFLLSL